MLGLTSGELTLVLLLVFAVVSAKFWPAVGAKIALRLGGLGEAESASKRTNGGQNSAERH
jgi:hypothetical protein